MPELSPHAQAVKDAVLALYSDEKVQKFGWRLDVRTVAAALRAAADQLFPEPDYWTKDNMSEQGLRLLRLKRDQLLAIATELESND